ncbi:hypothetical protein AC578_6104 [Pseudocercospora eumusae]|uniref:Uncharacterized protein n=1 Tax=Pseudocercospora eumusae TaxID=321146 RepID=A0A139HVS1_9PEZI|nr:hypothetical protein AC578_6104 [Pseudocercospora eumusae]
MASTRHRPPIKRPLAKDDCSDCFRHVSDPEWQQFQRAKEGEKVGDEEVLKGFGYFDKSFASVESAAQPPKCPKSCMVCSGQYRTLHSQANIHTLRYAKALSDADAAKQISNRLKAIRANFEAIGQLMQQYGDVFVKRWSKKSPGKRYKLLISVMPQAYKRGSDGVSLSTISCSQCADCRSALLLPWLNIEYLSQDPHSLFALLHTRATNNNLSSWALFDQHQLAGSFSQGALSVAYNPHCVMMDGGDDVAYGALVPWDMGKAHRREIIGFPMAQLIFDSQELLSSYLKSTVDMVLQNGLEEATRGDRYWTKLIESDFRADSNSSSFQRRPMAFATPPTLCLAKMLETFQSRHASAKDEAELLQTDPAFAKDLLSTAERSTVHKAGCGSIQSSILPSLMTDSLSRLQMMFQICEQISLTQEAFQKEPEQVHRAEYATTLRTLDAVLAGFFEELLAKSRRLSLHLGLFDEHFYFGMCGCEIPLATKKSDKDPVFNALNAMSGHNRDACDLPGHFIHQAQSHSDRLPLKLSECLADMAAVDEAVMAIRCFRPSFGAADVATIPKIAEKHQECKHWRTVAYDDHVTQNITKYEPQLSRQLETFIKTPLVDSKINLKSVTNFDASHEKLGAFWSEYAKVRMTLLREKQCPEDIIPEAMDTLRFRLSKDYTDSRESERCQILAAVREKEDAARRRQQLSTPSKSLISRHAVNEPCQTVWGSADTQGTPKSRHQLKEKVKTRPDIPTPARPEDLEPNIPEHDEEEEQEDRIQVSSNTMDIVHRMFVTYGKHMTGSVRWNVFVAALEDAGLAAEHDNGGSEVTFRDVKRGKGSIVFHAPHPDPRINPICMRAYGKRLQRQLGWSYELFVERE